MNILWAASRSTGLVSLVLLTAVVVLGIVTAGGWATARWPRLVTAGMHRTVSLLAVTFLVVHIATVVLDGYVPVDVWDAVVPFATPYQTLWLALGTVAVDLMLALVLTSLLRTRLPAALWRGVHWLAYTCWALATIHALGVGTDSAATLGIAVASTIVVAAAAIARLASPAAPGAPRVPVRSRTSPPVPAGATRPDRRAVPGSPAETHRPTPAAPAGSRHLTKV